MVLPDRLFDADAQVRPRVPIGWRFALVLFLLTLLIGELHEQVHIQVGRLFCGCYGPRDFNVWSTCDACAMPGFAPLATLAGPLFSYAAMWSGVWLLVSAQTLPRATAGIALIFAPLPFARIVTALMGRGDETTFVRAMAGDAGGAWTAAVGAGVVLLFCLPPVVMTWYRLAGHGRLYRVAGLCLLPMFAHGLYVRLLLNGVLSSGYLATPIVGGSPALVLVHAAATAVILAVVVRWRNAT